MTLLSGNPVYTIKDYFTARVPDFATLLPGFNSDIAQASAMAYYWRKLWPGDVEPYDLEEARLNELQKTLVALRMVVSAIPQMLSGAATTAGISKVVSGPDSFQFEERVKYYSAMMKNWQTELEQMESAMGLTKMSPVVPPFRKTILGVSYGFTE